jgi:hypothetical protein
MSMRHIIHVLRSAYRGPTKTPLGRWNIDNHKQTKLKIQYANEDNCGTCQYDNGGVNQQITQYNHENSPNEEGEELYLYMMGVDSVPDCRHTIR